jgi:hypothetical protein
LLAKGLCPAKRFKDGPDQIIFRLAFVGSLRDREAIEDLSQSFTKVIDFRFTKRAPRRYTLYGFSQKSAVKRLPWSEVSLTN